jgi:GxxExxY protein
LLYKDLTYKIRGTVFAVWKELGPAFKESIYQKALEKEFEKQNISFVSQRQIDIFYDGKKIGIYKPDFIVNDKILIEIKVLPRLTKLEEKQTWYYLKGTNFKLALLINFGGQKLQIKRWIYDKARKKYK